MPGPLPNRKWEAFCLLILKQPESKLTDVECYIDAGYNVKTQGAAEANASRLLSNARVQERLQELRGKIADKVTQQLAVTTTDVARHLWQLSYYDVRDVLAIETTGRGRARRQRVVVKDTADWPEAMARTCQGIKVNPDGSVQILLPDRRTPGTKVGEHLGMFQGESAGTIGGPTNVQINDNRTQVFVDKPRNETVEEWSARIERERGVRQQDPALRAQKTNGTNGAGNGKS